MSRVEGAINDVFLMDAGRLGNEVLKSLDAIREADPIFWSDKSQCWFVTRNQDVLDGFSGELPLSSNRLHLFSLSTIPPAEQPSRIPNLLRYATQMMIDIDPPQHTRIRKLMAKTFGRKVVDDTRPYVRSKVAELMAMIAARSGEVEFVEDVARRLPASVILNLLGLPDRYLPYMKQWANAFIGALASSRPPVELLDEAERAAAHMAEVAMAAFAERRNSPTGDLLTTLLKAHDDEDRLTDEELIATVMLLIVAGHDTTSNSMTLIVAALAEHPECWEYIYLNADKIHACVDELMRYVAMSFVQPRVAAEDFEWRGKPIKQGQIVMLLQGTGNRDPRVYNSPEKLDFERPNDKVLTFGPGAHHCLGHLLAKMQLAEFLSALVSRFKAVEVLDPNMNFMPQIGFRGLYSLNVRFTPR